jgi:methylamine dehydrogenase heavy chain
MKRTLTSVAFAAACLAAAPVVLADELKDLPSSAKPLGGEQHALATLSKPYPKRVYVLEPVFPVFVAGKIWVINGEKQDIEAVMSAGYAPNFAIAPDHSQLYVFDTYWSKGFRGTRTDIATFYDPLNLTIGTDVDLPKGRFLVVPKKQNAEVTPDGRYLLSYNLAPATTVSVVDTKERKYKGDVEIPGCGLIFPSAGNRFSSVCSDGTLATATFDANVKATVARSSKFFDPDNDPVFEHVGIDKKKGTVYFVSYEGNIFPVDLSKEKPAFQPKWSLLTDADKAESWYPGGWQLIALHRATQKLYVLMHKGPKWTHKQGGEEVWVFDAKTKKRTDRIKLKEHAISITVSQDAEPYLFTQTEKPSLITYNLKDGSEVGEVEFGISPYLLYVDGD